MTRILLLTALLLIVAAPASAALLKSDIRVNGDQVLLSDIFADLPDGIDRAIAPAPKPGGQYVLDRRTITRVAARYRVSWSGPATMTGATITRVARSVEAPAIAESLADQINIEGDFEGDIRVELNNRATRLHLAGNAKPVLDFENVRIDPLSRRFKATLIALSDTSPEQRKNISGRIVETIKVPVPARRLTADDVIARSDLNWISIERGNSAESYADENALVGMSPRRPLAAGRPIRERDIQQPLLVKRNHFVQISYLRGNLSLGCRGRALADASKGETVRVLNPASNRIVDAVVTGSDQVAVSPIGQ
ncbi:MAG: flagellar basal body P-ring formation chaperone FlgA [Pseudomonadota bacterium]|nr:flagellar basal body P-ring formation chaperone FlgA [Pseudomonadota bacterium]